MGDCTKDGAQCQRIQQRRFIATGRHKGVPYRKILRYSMKPTP